MRKLSRIVASALGALVLVAGVAITASPAAAVPQPDGPGAPRTGPNTEVTLVSTAEGQDISGAAPSDGTQIDPAVPYPAAPSPIHTEIEQGFAGIINAEDVDGTPLRLFCVDVLAITHLGYGYEGGTWEASGRPNLGFVARILNDYYPNTGEPAAAPDDDVRAAAVQVAIWYFTDNFVLDAADPVRPYVAAIVNAVRTQPPLPAPAPPTISLTPASSTATVGTVAGPVTLDTLAPSGAVVTATGGTMWADSAGTVPIANGSTIMDGQQIWVKPDDPSPGASVSIRVSGEATVATGNVYLYDGNTPDVSEAQELMIAETTVLDAAATATVTFAAPVLGSLAVSKTFAGSAAGAQGAATVHVSCTNGLELDISFPAGATGTTTTTFADIPAGTVCTVTEPVSGAHDTTTVTPGGLGQVQIAEGVNTISLTNTVSAQLAPTGGDIPWQAAAFALLLVVGGSALLARRRLTIG